LSTSLPVTDEDDVVGELAIVLIVAVVDAVVVAVVVIYGNIEASEVE
jgi:hypothetical protein